MANSVEESTGESLKICAEGWLLVPGGPTQPGRAAPRHYSLALSVVNSLLLVSSIHHKALNRKILEN